VIVDGPDTEVAQTRPGQQYADAQEIDCCGPRSRATVTAGDLARVKVTARRTARLVARALPAAVR